MAQLMILIIDELAPVDLTARLEAAHQVFALNYLMVDWWNRPGTFASYEAGLSELKTRSDECISGGAFGDAVDIAWRQVGDKFRVLLVTESDVSEFLTKEKQSGIEWTLQRDDVNRVTDSEQIELILWGTKHVGNEDNPTEPSKWVEGRIPRELVYPIMPVRMDGKDKKRDFEAVILHAIAYYDARGRPVVYRRYGLRAQLESKERAQKRRERRDLSGDDDSDIPEADEEAAADDKQSGSEPNAESASVTKER